MSTSSDTALAAGPGVVIVGASVAGIRTAQALRRQGYPGAVTVIGEETHRPYDKPPLSKGVLAAGRSGSSPLLGDAELHELNVELRLGIRAVGLDPVRGVVFAEDGREIAYSELVIATGVIPRVLPGDLPHGVLTLRRIEDALELHSAFLRRDRLVIVGAGFIGAEVASAAREHDVEVDLVEVQPVPMAHLFGPVVGQQLSELHARHGATLHAGVGVSSVGSMDGRVTGVELSDGRTLRADIVVVGIGARPATDWLLDSGLPVGDGILCDVDLRVVGYPHIHAAGDVAHRPMTSSTSDGIGAGGRLEHWTNAGDDASIVAADLAGGPPPGAQVPYVWSDQYGHRIQVVGSPAAGQLALLRGNLDESSLVAVYVDAAGRSVGALVADDPRLFMRCRRAVKARTPVADVEGMLPALAAG